MQCFLLDREAVQRNVGGVRSVIVLILEKIMEIFVSIWETKLKNSII